MFVVLRKTKVAAAKPSAQRPIVLKEFDALSAPWPAALKLGYAFRGLTNR